MTAKSEDATRPTRGAVEKLGAAPLGVTVVDDPLLLASWVTLEGCEPSVRMNQRKAVSRGPQSLSKALSHIGGDLPVNEAPHVFDSSD